MRVSVFITKNHKPRATELTPSVPARAGGRIQTINHKL